MLWDRRKRKSVARLIGIIKKSLEESADINSNFHLNNQPEHVVELRYILQVFWGTEKELDVKKGCKGDCQRFSNSSFYGGDGCFGTLYNCDDIDDSYDTQISILQVCKFIHNGSQNLHNVKHSTGTSN